MVSVAAAGHRARFAEYMPKNGVRSGFTAYVNKPRSDLSGKTAGPLCTRERSHSTCSELPDRVTAI